MIEIPTLRRNEHETLVPAGLQRSSWHVACRLIQQGEFVFFTLKPHELCED